MRVTKELRLSLSVAVIVLLASVFFSYAQQQDTAKSSVPALTEVEKRFAPKAGEQPKEVPDLPSVDKRFLSRPAWGPQEAPALHEVERKFLPRGGPFPLEVAQLPEIGWPEVREFKDFKGGLDLSTCKTKVPPDRAIVLENALWNEQGEMYKRPGFSEHSTPPFNPNFLYRYYKQDGKKFTMGGSDTSLHFWHEDSSGDGWTYLMNTGGYTGRWDGCTFEDMFIGAHEGISPIAWDGATLINVGEQSYSYDSSWAANCSLYVHVENVAWDDNQFVGFYAVQDSASCSDSGMPFGQIVRNTLDVFTIRYNATSGTNLWGADQNVTLLSALEDSVWAAGIIDTFYTMGDHQSEVLVPGVDTIRAEWTAVPAGSLYINISDYPDTTSHDDYCYTDDTTSVMIVGFGDHTSALTDIDRIWLNIIASNNIDQEIGTAIYVVVRLCHPDTTNYFSYLWQVNQGLENFPYSKKYTRFRVPLPTTPRGHVWTDEGLDSLMLYLMATNRAEGNFGFGDQRLEVFDAWIGVDYEQYNVACGFMVYDTSLFDVEGLLDNDMTVPTYFELIPEGYDGTPGSPSKTTRQIIDIDSGIYSADYWGYLNYLKLAEPEISGLAVGDSFQLRHLYFPTSKFVENFDARLWLGWTGTGADQNKNVVLYSALSDIANWPPGNEIYIESDDGDYITGMTQFYPDQQGHRSEPWAELVVSKEQSLYRVYPTTFAGELDYNTMFISRGVGCCSNLAMAMIEGKFVAFPDQHGVWLYNGTGVQPISLLIDPIFEDLALANLEDMSAIYNPQDRHYYLSGPELFDEAYPGGEFICVFEMDSAQSVDGYWIHEFDATGNETGDDLRKLGATYTSAGGYLDIAAKSDKEYAIMFKQSSGATGFKVFLVFFGEDGAQIGDTLRIDDGGNDGYANNDDHKLDMNAAGQIIACWTDTEDAENDIRCQIVHFDSGLVGSNFNVNSDHATNTEPATFWGVGINEEGVAVITWQDMRENTEALTEIYAQRFQYPDNVLGSNFRVNNCWTWDDPDCVPCTNGPDDGPQGQCAYNENKPAVAVGPRTFVIAWYSSYEHCVGQTCLYKRAFNIDGTAREDELLLSDCAGGNIQEPSIAMNSLGNYVIAYDKECDHGYAIYMMAFDSSDAVRFSETQVSDADTLVQGPDVAINNNDIIVVVWYDGQGDANVEISYRSYDWNGTFMASDFILSSSAFCQYPEIDCFLSPPDTSLYTLAWNIDYRGWSKETFSASAYAYQHGLTDPVKVLFADPEETKVYNYGTQADDVNDAVVLTYQSPYLSFVQNPSWDVVMSYATLEAFLDTGEVYVYWYKDYSELVHVDTISCGGDCRKEIQLPPWDVTGHNISMKIITGAEIDDFTLSGYWWEYLINRWRN